MDLIKFKEEIKKIDEEIQDRKYRLIEEARHRKLQVIEEYALSNNDIKIGDLVTDRLGTIRVEFIDIYQEAIPSCFYEGKCTLKSGRPFTFEKRRVVFQNNISKT